MQTQQINGGLAVTATWEARDGEADTVADILARFAPQARKEPGVKLFLVHRAWRTRRSSCSMNCSRMRRHLMRISRPRTSRR